jgi:hypothetical protein
MFCPKFKDVTAETYVYNDIIEQLSYIHLQKNKREKNKIKFFVYSASFK